MKAETALCNNYEYKAYFPFPTMQIKLYSH